MYNGVLISTLHISDIHGLAFCFGLYTFIYCTLISFSAWLRPAACLAALLCCVMGSCEDDDARLWCACAWRNTRYGVLICTLYLLYGCVRFGALIVCCFFAWSCFDAEQSAAAAWLGRLRLPWALALCCSCAFQLLVWALSLPLCLNLRKFLGLVD